MLGTFLQPASATCAKLIQSQRSSNTLPVLRCVTFVKVVKIETLIIQPICVCLNELVNLISMMAVCSGFVVFSILALVGDEVLLLYYMMSLCCSVQESPSVVSMW